MAGIGRFAVPSLLGGVAAGIFAADAGWLGPRCLTLLVALAVISGVGGSVLRRSAPGVMLAGTLLGLGIGASAGTAATLPAGPGSVEALVGHEVAVSGVALDDPRARGTRQQMVLGDLRVGGDAVSGRLLLWLPRGIDVQAGDRLQVDGAPELAEDFDGFAYREYLARQGIGAILRAQGAAVIGHEGSPVQRILQPVRTALLDGLLRVVPEPEAALGAGILLGVRSGIAPEIGDAFAAAGLTHVVAISGWNIAIVAALVAAALRPLRGRRGSRWLIALLTGSTISCYVMLTGASPSVVRAGLMAAAMLIAQLGGSRTGAISALTLAALIMLILAPPVLWDVGFQLSLLATAGLILLGGSVERRLAWMPAWAREPIALTLASQVTTLPVILLNFERLSIVAPIANVIVAPLVPIVMLVGSLAMLASTLHAALPVAMDVLATVMAGATWLVLRLMILAGTAAAAVPFASLEVGAPAWLAAGYYPALALAIARRRPAPSSSADSDPPPPGRWARLASVAFHPLSVAFMLGAALLLVALLGRPDGRLHLVALDIGQGDAILVTAPSGARMLVDGGPDPDLTLRRLGDVMPFWDRRIDVVLLTHPHEDHVAGLIEVLRRFEVRRILEPGRTYENPSYARFLDLAAAEPGAATAQPRAGQALLLDSSTTIGMLYPTVADAAAPLLEDDINNGSIVVALRCGGFSALLAGDAEAPVEALLVERGLPRVDVLKVGHHGSESSSSLPFLAATHPRIGLISAGAGNEYGHPRQATLDALSAAGVSVFRTDTDGTIDVASDGFGMIVRSRRGVSAASVATPAAGCGSAVGQMHGAAARIGPWPFPTSLAPARSSTRNRFPAAWCCMPRASAAWRRRRHGSSPRRASRSTCGSSRSPPCCTTSTSSRPATATASTDWSVPLSSIASGIPSSRPRSPPTR
ncbi:MAG: ComEC/Rec2 family competence protein [Chloroflexota bacterium]